MNSPLVQHTRISPFQYGKRNHKIDTITIHCTAGQCLIENLGSWFQLQSVSAASNYGVDKDGRIGCFVNEDCAAITSNSRENDMRAVTIEVASDGSEPCYVRDAAYASMLNLVEDVCRRNGIMRLVWSDNKTDRMLHLNGCNMTVHRDYNSGKSCPGGYLMSKMPNIAAEINRRLNAASDPTPTPASTPSKEIKAGDKVKIIEGATYTNGRTIPNIIRAETWIVKSVNGSTALIDKSVNGGWSINSTVDVKYLQIADKDAFVPYIIRVDVDALHIRLAPTTLSTIVGVIKDRGAYTIVAESDGIGATKWGKLKSGAGWISLDYVHFVRNA